MMFCIESTLGVASFSNFNVISMPFSNLPFTTGDVRRTIGYTAPYPVKHKGPHSIWTQESRWQYILRPQLNAPCVHRILRKLGYRDHLVDFRRHSMSSPASHTLHKKFRRRLHLHLHRQLRPQALDDVQAHYNLLYKLASDTGASFETMNCSPPLFHPYSYTTFFGWLSL